MEFGGLPREIHGEISQYLSLEDLYHLCITNREWTNYCLTNRDLLRKKYPPSIRAEALADAIHTNNYSFLKFLLDMGIPADQGPFSGGYATVLEIAIQEQNQPMIHLLIDRGAKTTLGSIVRAINNEDSDTLKLLLRKGYNRIIGPMKSNTIKDLVHKIWKPEIIQILLDSGIDDPSLVELLLDSGIDDPSLVELLQMRQKELKSSAYTNLTPVERLRVAIERGDIYNFILLTRHYRYSKEDLQDALIQASREGKREILHFLLSDFRRIYSPEIINRAIDEALNPNIAQGITEFLM